MASTAHARRVRHTGARTGLELWAGHPLSSDLVRDYIAGDDRLAPFFAGFPFDPDAFHRKAKAVHDRLRPDHRSRLTPALRPTSDGAARKIQEVLAGRGLAVTTGQQAGLFGGPLYTVYKILTAVKLAESLERLFDEPVVPVFWMASDDHDWAEVNHAQAIDSDDELRRLGLDDPADVAPVAMSDRALPQDIERVVAEYAAMLPDTAFAGPMRELLQSAYRPDVTAAAAFERLLLGLLDGFDLVLLDPSHPAVKQASAPLLARELAHADAHAALLRAQTDRLLAEGYHEQVTVSADAANVFLHDDSGRDRLARENDGWLLRRSRRALSGDELSALLASQPDKFSPNVFLRPVIESALIPTVAYVGGPGEIAYFAQIGCLFQAHGVEPPLVVPRRSVTIVEPRIRRVLDKFGFEPDAFDRPLHEVTTAVIHSELPPGITEPIARLQQTAQEAWEALADSVVAIDPTLHEWAMNNRNKSLSQIRKADKKITAHLKKRSEIEITQLRRASTHLHPGGSPQERVLNPISYVARYGPDLLQDIADTMTIELDCRAPTWKGVVCSGEARIVHAEEG